jgi:hypothetical protein
VRAIVVALLMAAFLGSFGVASAQESGAEPGSGVSVSVSCLFDEASGLSTCDFTPVDSAGGAVSGITIPGEILCAPVSGDYAGGAIYTALPDGLGSASVTFVGAVSVGGTASYTVDLAGGPVEAAGGSLVCESAAPTEPDVTTDDVGDEPIVVDTTTDEGGPIDGELEISEDETSGEIAEVENVTITIYAYDCVSDPNGADPAEYSDCTPSEGIELAATVDGEDAGTVTTDINGWATFSALDGSAFVVAENLSTLPDGYEPYGNGVAFITAEADSVIVFIHLTEPLVGRLQIVNGSCPTSGEDRTEFRVIEPASVAAADAPECAATGGTIFTILGGTLAEGGISVVTGDDGAWRGFLPAGTYTVVDDSGASGEVTVIVDDISVVVVVDYISHPIGVLNVSRFLCEAEAAGIEITFFGSEPSVGDDDGCDPVDGTITIDVVSEVSAASVVTFDLGADGVEEIELEPGDYVLSDDNTGETANFTIEGGTRLFAVVQDLVVSDDGVGNPGGEDPGGENPGGNPAPDPGDGTGGAGGDGTGNPSTGNPDGGTDGGVDAGESVGGTSDGDYVTQLPATGVESGDMGADGLLLALLTLSGGLVAGAVALQRSRRAA